MSGPPSVAKGPLSLLLVAVLSSIAGVLVAVGHPELVLLPLLLAGFAVLPREYKLALSFLVCFYPFSLGQVGSIPQLLIAEVLVPAAFPVVLFGVVRNARPVVPRNGGLFAVAGGMIVLVGAFHFLVGPVAAGLSGASLGATGLRPFYDLGVYVLLFFMTMWLLDYMPWSSQSWVKFLRTLMFVSAVLAVLRVFTGLSGIDTPLLGGVFDYGGRTSLAGGSYAFRIGGLAESAGLGLASLGALWIMRAVKPSAAVAFLLSFLVAAGLSGGRALTIGLIVAGFAYLVGPVRVGRLRVVIVSAVMLSLAWFTAVMYGFATQINRILALEGGIEQQDPARFKAISVLWQYFLDNPLIGKGIGVAGEGLVDQFVAAQVLAGGHSSYASILGNFGIIGGFFLASFTLVPLVSSFLSTRRTQTEEIHGLFHALMAFVAVQTIVRAIEYVVGGTGYNDPRMYLVTGLYVAVLFSSERAQVVR